MKVGVPGMSPFSRHITALMTPELPAAGSECPILLLIFEREQMISRPMASWIHAFRLSQKQEDISYRSDYQRLVRSTSLRKDGARPVRLGGIPRWGTRTVTLQIGCIIEVGDTGTRIRLPDRGRLCLGARTCKTVCPSIAGKET